MCAPGRTPVILQVQEPEAVQPQLRSILTEAAVMLCCDEFDDKAVSAEKEKVEVAAWHADADTQRN